MNPNADLPGWIADRLAALDLDPAPELPTVARCVVGVDGTEDSCLAARWAAHLADEIHLVYAEARGYPGQGASPGAIEALGKDARFACDMVDGELEGLTVEEHVLDASPARAMVQVAETVEAQVICVSPRHRSMDEGGLGTVSQSLVHHAPFPVLLAKAGLGRGPVLVGVGDDRSSRSAVGWGQRLSEALARELVLVHAAPEDLERIDLADFEAKRSGARAELIGWPAGPALERQVEAEAPSLLVLGHGHHSDWLGSTALRLLEEAGCPVLVVPWGMAGR